MHASYTQQISVCIEKIPSTVGGTLGAVVMTASDSAHPASIGPVFERFFSTEKKSQFRLEELPVLAGEIEDKVGVRLFSLSFASVLKTLIDNKENPEEIVEYQLLTHYAHSKDNPAVNGSLSSLHMLHMVHSHVHLI
jgi:hypothetical protein